MKLFIRFQRWLARQSIRLGWTPTELSRYFDPQTFFTWHRRPISPSDHLKSPRSADLSMAIIMQGPLIRKNAYTIETLRYYRLVAPNLPIIFSSWDDIYDHERSELSRVGVEVVISEKPKVAGPSNVNFQLRSTRAGISHADFSLKYGVKLRSDQRLYNPNSFHFMANLLERFPSSDGAVRFGAISTDTFRNRLFGLSDMVQFSTLESLADFWRTPEVPSPNFQAIQGHTPCCPEDFLTYSYLARQFPNRFSPNDEGWLDALGQLFLIGDASSFDFHWAKYSKREYLWRRYNTLDWCEIGFADWLEIEGSHRK